MFLGLCTLADWIGSNEAWFPFCDVPGEGYLDVARQSARRAVAEIGLDISGQRGTLPGGLPSFPRLFGFDPNAIQQAAALDTPLYEQLVVVESETGSGKTEAALWRFARMYERGLVDGLYFALPTRAAATQLHGRVTRFVNQMFPGSCPPEPVLAVPGYLRAGDITGRHLQDYVVWWDDDPDDATRGRRWAAESAKRYLAAQIAVGTVDQAMMAALKVKHAHMRAACLARNLLVVDEVHASDTYMRGILRSLLDAHLGAGGYALLMSATLGSSARRQWLSTGRSDASVLPLDEAISSPYPAVSVAAPDGDRLIAVGENSWEKTVRIDAWPRMQSYEWVAERALQAARAGAKVLVIRNTVDYAIGTQQAVEQAAPDDRNRNLLFACQGTLTLHHGRFAAGDRRLLDSSVEERLGKDRTNAGGVVVVGTQTLEQSLDIDADLLISDLCPVDVLLQRIGRLHPAPTGRPPPWLRSPRLCRADTGRQRPHTAAAKGTQPERAGPPRVRVPGPPCPRGHLAADRRAPPVGYPPDEPEAGGTGNPPRRPGDNRPRARRRLAQPRQQRQRRRNSRRPDRQQRHHPARQVLLCRQPGHAIRLCGGAHPHPARRRGHRDKPRAGAAEPVLPGPAHRPDRTARPLAARACGRRPHSTRPSQRRLHLQHRRSGVPLRPAGPAPGDAGSVAPNRCY